MIRFRGSRARSVDRELQISTTALSSRNQLIRAFSVLSMLQQPAALDLVRLLLRRSSLFRLLPQPQAPQVPAL